MCGHVTVWGAGVQRGSAPGTCVGGGARLCEWAGLLRQSEARSSGSSGAGGRGLEWGGAWGGSGRGLGWGGAGPGAGPRVGRGPGRGAAGPRAGRGPPLVGRVGGSHGCPPGPEGTKVGNKKRAWKKDSQRLRMSGRWRRNAAPLERLLSNEDRGR